MPDEFLLLYKFKWLFPFFLAGAMVKRTNKESKKINIFFVLTGIVIFYAMATFLYEKEIFATYTTYNYGSLEDIAGGILCYMVSFIGIWAVLEASVYLKRMKVVEKILSVIGRYSMDIYVIHMFLIKVLFICRQSCRKIRFGEIHIFIFTHCLSWCLSLL